MELISVLINYGMHMNTCESGQHYLNHYKIYKLI